MSNTPSELKYAASHEWVRVEEDGTVSVGITDHAQEALGDVVYVETPELGDNVEAGSEAGVVESVKAASDIFAPISGEVIAVNETLEDEPEIINSDSYHDGWFFRVKPTDLDADLAQLMSADEYIESLEDE